MKEKKKGNFSKYIKDDNIRAEMARNRYTNQDMSFKLGYKSRAAFNAILNGKIEPRVSTIAKLVTEFKQPAENFFNFEVNK